MSTRSRLRHVFRYHPRVKIGDDALPYQPQNFSPGLSCKSTDGDLKPVLKEKLKAPSSTFVPPPKTPEPFGLENIVEEYSPEVSPSVDAASLTESLERLDLEVSAFSTRELVYATLDEANAATRSHLDTIDTTLALLDALDGFSATISELKKEMLGKKQECQEKIGVLEAVERAIEGMLFAGESRELNTRA